MSAIDTVLAAAEAYAGKPAKRIGANKYKTLCPVHGDQHDSCDIEDKDGTVVAICRSQRCAFKDIAAGWGIKECNFFPPKNKPAASTGQRTCFDYQDEAGNLVRQVVRTDYTDGRDKKIYQRRPDGKGGWINDMVNVRRVVYGLPELKAASPDEPIYLVAGEKCVGIMRAHGFVATSNVAGEGKWTAEDSEFLRGRDVVLFCDNDPTGRKDAELKTSLLLGVARSIRVLDVIDLPLKGDCEQYFQAGHTAEELRALAAATKPWNPASVPVAVEAAPLYDPNTTEPKPAAEEPESICLATVEPCRVGWLWFGRLASGEMVIITGPPGTGKGLLLCYIVARFTTGKPMHGDRVALPAGHVLWISMEDAPDTSLAPRLIAARADRSRVHVWNLKKPVSLPADADRIVAELKRLGCALLIIDPAPTLLDKDHNSNNDANVRQSFAALSAACRDLGCGMILVRHTNKRQVGTAMDRGGGSIGWTGMARVELMLGRRPVEEGATVADTHESVVTLATVKNNLGKWAPSLNLAIVEAGESARMEIIGETEATADDLCAQDKPKTARKVDAAADILRRVLADGEWHRWQEIYDAAQKADISAETVKRAKGEVRAESRQRAGSNGWWWRIDQSTKGECACPSDPLPSCPSDPLPSNNIKYLEGQSIRGSQIQTYPPEGKAGDEAALDADFRGDAPAQTSLSLDGDDEVLS